jgi:hypothetical protein
MAAECVGAEPHSAVDRERDVARKKKNSAHARCSTKRHGRQTACILDLTRTNKQWGTYPRRLHPGFIAMAHVRPHTVHDPSLPRTNVSTRCPRSSRHEPLLSTRLGHPLDCASCRTYRLMPSLPHTEDLANTGL